MGLLHAKNALKFSPNFSIILAFCDRVSIVCSVACMKNTFVPPWVTRSCVVVFGSALEVNSASDWLQNISWTSSCSWKCTLAFWQLLLTIETLNTSAYHFVGSLLVGRFLSSVGSLVLLVG